MITRMFSPILCSIQPIINRSMTILGVKKLLLQPTIQNIINIYEMCNVNKSTSNDEVHMTTPELIFSHGYQAETHHIWTSDNYRLEIHRVLPAQQDKIQSDDKKNKGVNNDIDKQEFAPTTNQSNSSIPNSTQESLDINQSKIKITNRPTVLIHHGLLSSSADWVLLGPKRALAYVLCDEGYDVWLANARGNRYSRCHKKYTTKDKEFWDFSWHEIGVNDLPAIIDYIVEKTGNKSMYYIGYSQGTTAFFVMASECPEYMEKIKGVICMAPIAFLSNHRSPLLKLVVPLNIVMKWASSYCNINQWFPRNKLQVLAFATLMRKAPEKFAKILGSYWFYLVAGFGSDQLDKSMLPIVFGHFPAGASAKQIIHYSQTIKSGLFRQFDYGTEMNLKKYGTQEPPKYDLTKVTVPVGIFYSDNDFLNHPSDVETLANALPNVVMKTRINYNKFNHVDYLWGRDAKTLVYNDIIKVLKSF